MRGTTGHRWIPFIKKQWRSFEISVMLAWANCSINNQMTGDLGRHDIALMACSAPNPTFNWTFWNIFSFLFSEYTQNRNASVSLSPRNCQTPTSTLFALCKGNSTARGIYPSPRIPLKMASKSELWYFFVISLNKLLSKQLNCQLIKMFFSALQTTGFSGVFWSRLSGLLIMKRT